MIFTAKDAKDAKDCPGNSAVAGAVLCVLRVLRGSGFLSPADTARNQLWI